MDDRIKALEERMSSVENTLQMILARLKMSSSGETIVPVRSSEALPPPDPKESGPFEYRPLDTSRSEFRVLALANSAKDDDPINCDLVHLSLDFDPLKPPGGKTSAEWMKLRRLHTQFGALSYTWGGLNLDGSIIIAGRPFKITRNLETALRQMRKAKRPAGRAANMPVPSYWWIDAICINQQDNAERGQQVSCMTRIYKRASAVHVWLGEERDDSTLALDVLRKLGDIIRRAPGEAEYRYPVIPDEQKERHRRALIALFNRPWWERVWVRQEIALPRVAKFYCGDIVSQFSDFRTAHSILGLIKERLGFDWTESKNTAGVISHTTSEAWVPSDAQHSTLLFNLQRECNGGNNFISFKDALFSARSCKATDPRDKVFSVLGLTDPEVYRFKADYSLSLVATYKAAVRTLVAATKSIDILSACQNPDRLHGFPSWIPNLVDEWKAKPFQPKQRRHQVSDKDAEYVFEDSTNTLKLRGEFLDTINRLSEHGVQPDNTAKELDTLYLEWKTIPRDPYVAFLTDRRYIQNLLSETDADGSWISFLSLDDDDGSSLERFERGQSSINDPKFLDDIPNYRMARSLLSLEGSPTRSGKYSAVHTYLRNYGVGRRLCISRNGMLGLVPQDARVGDSIVVFYGGSFHYIIRPLGEQYVLVGEAYLPTYPYSIRGERESQYFSLV